MKRLEEAWDRVGPFILGGSVAITFACVIFLIYRNWP
jgi:hypothetical protein